jgi:non-heme chloroperoxidase
VRGIIVLETWLTVFLAAISLLVSVLLGAPAAFAWAAVPATGPEPRVRDVRLPGGIRLRYLEQGPESGPAVLLLHGYTDSSYSFSRIMPLLPVAWRVIALDQRGHGESDRPESGYAIDDFAADALQAMDALRLPSAVVVGHSMGSFIARRMAERAPDRVTHLVLLASAPTAANDAVKEMRGALDALSDPVDPAFVREFQESTVARPVPAAFMDRVVATSQAVPAAVWKAALAGLLSHQASGSVRCPTLVIGGDADGVFSKAEQEALAAEIPGAVLEIVPGVGHALHWEDPERFVASLRRVMGQE